MASTTGRWNGVVRGPPSASPTRESRGQATVIHPVLATTANLGVFSALIQATQLAI